MGRAVADDAEDTLFKACLETLNMYCSPVVKVVL